MIAIGVPRVGADSCLGDDSDAELMTRYQAGDETAFAELYRRYAPRLTRALSRYTRDRDAVNDLVQSTFLRVHRARDAYDPQRPFRPWVFTIARNIARSRSRRAARWILDVQSEGSLQVEALPMEHLIDRPHTREKVRASIGQLPEGQRIVIESHWLNGESLSGIANRLGLGLSAVKVRAHRGYKRLRESLADKDLLEAA